MNIRPFARPFAQPLGNVLQPGGTDAPAGTPPVNATPPSISTASPQEGVLLTVTKGTWTGAVNSIALELRYVSDETVIASGSDSFDYTPDSGDVGEELYAVEVATNDDGDSDPATSSATSTTLPAPPEITTTTLPDAVVGTPYSADVVATGAGPITYEIISGPGWLSINSSTGHLSGDPAL